MHICTINGGRVAPEHVERLRTILVEYARDVRDHEPGCRLIRLHQEHDAPEHFVVYSEFEDHAAYDAHLASAHVARLRETLHVIMGDTHHKTILRSFE